MRNLTARDKIADDQAGDADWTSDPISMRGYSRLSVALHASAATIDGTLSLESTNTPEVAASWNPMPGVTPVVLTGTDANAQIDVLSTAHGYIRAVWTNNVTPGGVTFDVDTVRKNY